MNSFERFMAKSSFRGQKKIRIIRQLTRLIGADVSLSLSLELLYQMYSRDGKKPKEPIALMIKQWSARLDDGKSLSKAMSGWVSPSEQMIIEAGEQSENLGSALEDAMEANSAASGIRKTIIGGLAYPLIMFVFLVFILFGFQLKIAPAFETIIPSSSWTGKAAVMYDISAFVVEWAGLLGMILGATIAFMVVSFPILTGPVRKYLDRIPPYSIYKITQGASYMITMRGFLSAGAPVPEALRRMMVTGNPYFRERVKAIYARVMMGRNLGQAMKEAGHNFPDDDISGEVSIYAGLDSFTDSLDVLAKEWIHGAQERASVATKVINIVMMVLIATAIIFIALSMFDLQNDIRNYAGQ